VANPAAAPSPTVPLPCPPGKCPVALVQSDTLHPADWTIGYSSPRSDIAVTTKYRTGIAAELGCALHRRQFLPGNREQLFRQSEITSVLRSRYRLALLRVAAARPR
jgi:hypothetical protein